MRPRPRSRSGFRRLVVGWALGTRPEEELLHLSFQKLAGLGLDRREPVFVDKHDLVPDPPGPPRARALREDARARRARGGCAVEARCFALQDDAVDGAGHVMLWISAETGAGRAKHLASTAYPTRARWASASS